MFIFILIVYYYRIYIFENKNIYGKYSLPITSPCVSSNGLCTGNGLQTTTTVCVPNGKYGCLINGKQTFATKIISRKCVPICRTSIWEIKFSDVTCYVDGFDTCITKDTKGQTYTYQKCVNKDSSGVNSCILNLPSSLINTNENKQELINQYYGVTTCILNTDGISVTCLPGTELYVYDTCVPDPNVYPLCGTWGVIDGNTVIPCTTSLQFYFSDNCVSFNGNSYSNINQTYSFGWTTRNMICNNSLYSEPDNKNIACKSLSPPDCVNNSTQILSSLNNEEGVVYCQGPSCVNTCIYYDQSLNNNTWYSDIIFSPFYITINGYYLTLNNTPAPAQGGSTIVPGIIIPNNILPFTDCFGTPNLPLLDTPMLYFNPKELVDHAYQFSKDTKICGNMNPSSTSASNMIRDLTSTTFLFKPASSAYGNSIDGYFIAFHGKNYLGYLHYADKIVWRQLDITNNSSYSVMTLFTLINNGNSYSIVLKSNPSLNLQIPVFTYTTKDSVYLSLNNIDIYLVKNYTYADPKIQSEPVIIDSNMSSFYNFLSQKQTRLNYYSCNLHYAYPVPEQYPNPDIVLLK